LKTLKVDADPTASEKTCILEHPLVNSWWMKHRKFGWVSMMRKRCRTV